MAYKERTDSRFDGNAARKLSAAPKRQEQREQQRKEVNRQKLIRLTERDLRIARRKNINPLKVAATITCIAVIFSLVGYSVYGQVQLTELTEKINAQTKSLTQLESVEVQLQMQATSSMNVGELEEYARNVLGMEKVNNSQITYLNLAVEDKGDVIIEDGGNFFDRILEFLGF